MKQRKIHKKQMSVNIIGWLWVGIAGMVVVINLFTIISTHQQKVSIDELSFDSDDQPIVMVLGAGVTATGQPSVVLKHRLDKAAAIYQVYPNSKLIMSGDHQGVYYDEVSVMKQYLVDQYAIPSEHIYLDHLGINTYSSLYRLKHTFGVSKVTIVTQSEHLSRALMMANRLGLEAKGIPAVAESRTKWSQRMREVIATVKAFIQVYTPIELTTVDDERLPIDLHQSGDKTD